MKAILVNYYGGKEADVIHTNVVSAPQKCRNKQFKCLDCGKEWTESINSPQILDEDVEKNINEYYKNIVYCKDLK